MAIKDLMKATEADRYTADGRDELNKALKADVEDRVYKPHEISPKTGLEKQGDGSWAPPKKRNKAAAGAGVPEEGNKPQFPAPGFGVEGIPKMKEADFVGKTYKDFVTSLPRGQFMITRNQDNPDGSSENDFTDIKHGGKKITVKFGPDGKITGVKQHENPTRTFQVGAGNQLTEVKPESKSAEWETKGKYQLKKFEDEKTLNNFLKENGFVEEGNTTTSFSEKGAIHETVYKKGNETLVKLTGPGINKPTIRKISKVMEAESKPAEKELIKIPTATGYAKVDKEAYAKYANNKTSVNLGRYIDRKMAGIPISESNKFYDFVKEKIYESGQDPTPYLGQSGYSYPQGLIDMYYDEWSSKKTGDSSPRVLTGDCKIRVRKA